jgi:hypothetical protein
MSAQGNASHFRTLFGFGGAEPFFCALTVAADCVIDGVAASS